MPKRAGLFLTLILALAGSLAAADFEIGPQEGSAPQEARPVSRHRASDEGVELAEVLRSVVAPRLAGRRWVAALLVATPTQYGQARQFEAYAEDVSRNQIFLDEGEALAWLAAQPLPDAPG